MRKILFNDRFGLTQAVLEGRKTMTRRILKAPRTMEGKDVYGFSVVTYRTGDVVEVMALDEDEAMIGNILPKYKVDEVVAVAQPYCEIIPYLADSFYKQVDRFMKEKPGYRNKMFVRADLMPHQLRITNIRVERLQNISDGDCLREGVVRYTCNLNEFQGMCYSYEGDKNKMGTYKTAREAFASLFDKISGKGAWDKNPWVFVYEFELLK